MVDCLLVNLDAFIEIGTHAFKMRVGPKFSTLQRTLHASCYNEYYIFIFGGIIDDGMSNDLLYYTKKNELFTCKQQGDVPTPRILPAMATIDGGKKQIIYGGMNAGYSILDDLYLLEESEDEKPIWRRIIHQKRGELLPSLIGHTCVSDGVDSLYVFGGYGSFGNSKEDKYSNLLFLIQLKFTSETLHPLPRLSFHTETLSSGPSARAGHAACMIGKLMFVFGGHNEKTILNDLWVYSISKTNHPGEF
jgi:hypothetical protein